MPMPDIPLAVLGWLFTFGVLAHNVEEAVWLPAWSLRAGRFHPPVTAPVFRFAVTLLSGVFGVITVLGTYSPPGSIGAYIMAGYVLAMVLNVFMPHLLATIVMRQYSPGIVTALLLNLPLGSLYLYAAFQQHSINLTVFAWAGPLVLITILASLPVLFMLGRRLHPDADVEGVQQ